MTCSQVRKEKEPETSEENIFIGVLFVTATAAVINLPTCSLWALFGSGLRKFVNNEKNNAWRSFQNTLKNERLSLLKIIKSTIEKTKNN